MISQPLVAWALFAAVMWFTHFSPLFDAALEDFTLHRLEHALFLVSALLFWWPVIGADPSPHRIGYGGRVLYLAVGMPLSLVPGTGDLLGADGAVPALRDPGAQLGPDAVTGPAVGRRHHVGRR